VVGKGDENDLAMFLMGKRVSQAETASVQGMSGVYDFNFADLIKVNVV
jgi:hypothetical protein